MAKTPAQKLRAARIELGNKPLRVAISSQYPVGALARQQFEQADDHMKRGEYAKAEDLFRHMLPSDVRVLRRKDERRRATNANRTDTDQSS